MRYFWYYKSPVNITVANFEPYTYKKQEVVIEVEKRVYFNKTKEKCLR